MTVGTAAWTILVCIGTSMLHITLLAGVALLLSQLLPRTAALRHPILLAALIGALLLPVAVIAGESFGYRLGAFSLADLLNPSQGHPQRLTMELAVGGQEPTSLTELNAESLGTFETALAQSRDELNAMHRAATLRTNWMVFIAASIGVVWLAVSFVLALRLFVSWMRSGQLVRRASPVNERTLASASRALALTRLRQMPQLRRSSRITTPVAVGFRHAAILIPNGLERHISTGEMTALLAHEMAHIARRDLLIVLLQRIAIVVLWPHPLIHILIRRLSQAREEICDNIALGFCDRIEYSRLLLRIHELAGAVHTRHVATGLLLSKWKLETRIEGILDHRRTMMTRTRPVHVALVVAMFGTAVLTLPSVTIANAAQDSDRSDFVSSAADIEKRIARLESIVAALVRATQTQVDGTAPVVAPMDPFGATRNNTAIYPDPGGKGAFGDTIERRPPAVDSGVSATVDPHGNKPGRQNQTRYVDTFVDHAQINVDTAVNEPGVTRYRSGDDGSGTETVNDDYTASDFARRYNDAVVDAYYNRLRINAVTDADLTPPAVNQLPVDVRVSDDRRRVDMTAPVLADPWRSRDSIDATENNLDDTWRTRINMDMTVDDSESEARQSASLEQRIERLERLMIKLLKSIQE